MTPPSTIGHCRIVSKLGEGGMGAVYRATDTKLNRDVAIKILPPEFAKDTARMQRFEREAQVLASLNHPNIAAIYGVEQDAIVMELVEGDDLQSPVSIDTAIDCARQIAAGLEAAHEKGIIHRDLKPANIKVTPAGTVKLLDFGLAKTTEALAAAASTSPTISPTLSLTMTQAGMILGTAAYMAPEQARGKPVDRRADIWAFGAVLFELLTGKMLFAAGDTVTDIIAAIVTREPDWSLLPPQTPSHIRRLLERCLRKDPRLRLQAIGEARIALDEPDTGAPAPPAAPAPALRSWLPWAVAALFAIVAAVVADIAWFHSRPLDTSLVTTRFALAFPEDTRETVSTYSPQTVPSPDGRYLAFIAADSKGIPHLWVRPMGSVSARLLDNTEGANFPFWSPDGQFIAFFAEMKLKKIAVAGGPPYPLCEAPDNSVGILDAVRSSGEGGSWSRDGVIVFSPNALSPLMRVSAKGGPATPVTSLEQTGDEGHIWPQFLPDGRHILYLANAEETSRRGLYVQELGAPQRVLVLRTQYRGAWAGGYLLFVRQGTLLAQRLNTRTFQLEGEPLSVAEEVTYHPREGSAAFAASENGVLIYHSGGSITDDRQLAWVDRSGKPIAPVGQPGSFLSVMLSPGWRSRRRLWDYWLRRVPSRGRRRGQLSSPCAPRRTRRTGFPATRRGR
jgi:predicted Ser/Thr protein kinase